MKKIYYCFFVIVFCYSSFGQSADYQSILIDKKYTKHANSCIRNHSTQINVESQDKMFIEHTQTITVFNKHGDKDLDAYLHYDKNINVKKLEAIVYDNSGKEIKTYKKRDFRDVSAVSGGTLYSDSRVYYLDYTPINYPYTVKFHYEVKSSNTAFLKPWRPIKNYYQSVINNEFTIVYSAGLNLRYLEKNLDFYDQLEVTKNNNQIKCKASDLKAIQREDYSPSLSSFAPTVHFALSRFNLEGLDGQAKNWEEFGRWRYDKMVKGRDEVTEETKKEILALTQGLDDLEKIKRVYEYVQSKTRYISVQVGIGGWQPIDAMSVDKKKYGDCKGLTNYTKALLKIAGIDSKYTVLYAGSEKVDVEKEFASMQGNHVILNVPLDNKDIWLECTNQDIPFGFLGDFTDDRDVLVIDENGGKIKHTDTYFSKDNYQLLSGKIQITKDGQLKADYTIQSEGVQFDRKYTLEKKSQKDIIKFYKSYYSHLKDLKIESYKFNNNEDEVKFIEYLKLTSKQYCKKFGNRFMMLVNALNQSIKIPNKYENRETPFNINRGFFDEDIVEIEFPDGMAIESKPDNIKIASKFGEYRAEFTLNEHGNMIYKRYMLLNHGKYSKDDYQNFRAFFKKINQADQSKIILLNKT